MTAAVVTHTLAAFTRLGLAVIPTRAPSLTINPYLPLWTLIPLLLAAIVVVCVLAPANRRLTSRGIVLLLTLIRLSLIVLVAILLLQPAFRWVQTHTSEGTVWLLVDRSPSMHATDPQATEAERIHWAQALGRVSSADRPAQPDYHLAAVTALAGQLTALRPDTTMMLTPVSPGDAAAELDRAKEFAARIGAWAASLDAVRKAALKDPVVGDDADALDALNRAASLARSGASGAASAKSLPGAAAAVDWPTIGANLTIATRELTTLAQRADADFIRDHGTAPDITNAVAQTKNLTRSDLAWLFLTNKNTRTGSTISDLLGKYHVRIASFADSAQTTGAPGLSSPSPSAFPDVLKNALASNSEAAAGQSTNIAQALQFVARQFGPDEPGAVIIVSDGRQNAGGDPTEPARLLASRNVRVFGLLTGSHEVSPDAAVEQVDAPDWVYKGDTLRAAALVRLDGFAGQTATVEFRRVTDAAAGTDVLLDSKTIHIRANQESQRVEFTDQPPDETAGGATGSGGPSVLSYKIRVLRLPGEVNPQNNEQSFRVAIKKDKLYALYIDDRPRWEYRYLAAYLARDPRIKLQTVLLSPAEITGVTPPAPVKASPQNPRIEAQILPETRQEWEAFDLIILGDVPPDKIPPAQQQFIASAVRDKGATLITIAGQHYMPAAYARSPLADLLPVTLNPQWTDADIARHMKAGFRPGLSTEGNASVLGQLGIDADSNAAMWSNIPNWYWHSPDTQAKPAASVIWAITEAGAKAAGAPDASLRKDALLATISIGIGHSLYLASDQTWRLRQVYGANVHDRFWGQVLRWAVGSDLPAGGKFVRFGASQQRYAQDQPVTIIARVLKEDLTPYTGLSFSAVATPKNAGAATQPAPGSPAASANSVTAHFVESRDTPGYYRATLGGLSPGVFTVTLDGPKVQRLLDTDPSATSKSLEITITPSLDLERQNMNTDLAMLTRIAQAGGGFALDAQYADVLAAHLPAVRQTHTSTLQLGFFTDPAATGTRLTHWIYLALFTLLLTTEWSLRKYAGLI